MKIRTMKGKAIAFVAIVLMSAAGTVAAIPAPGTCTAENQGQRVTERSWDGSSRIYLCDEGVWQTYAICDRYGRCVIVI
ncbi:hypothetical protein K4L06_13980 [Lysobacter sp. BMK333-48F3]|uniref:hypothetical protein n=1 Tax=Lysobacter sp. BMK333-48F3 TaxID=2867962 RepID=UPI001C8CB77C|nr:hypothetical protein [Lysobacter sp. BMK333-48F3]MBX9402420.1 hypothetical protein [Lysobacter sp. BMK333-48F3]